MGLLQKSAVFKDQFQKRKLDGNVPGEAAVDIGNDNSTATVSPDSPEIDPDNEIILESPNNSISETTSTNKFASTSKKSARMNNASAVKKIMMLEEQKLQLFKERSVSAENKDSDYHFLMSLLPYLR